MSLLRIELYDFLPWLESRLDEKYGPCIEPIKGLFLTIICLVNQLIHLYIDIRCQIMKYVKSDHDRDIGRTICDNSIYRLKDMTANFPGFLDLLYCEKFGKDFYDKMNGLLLFYHSLDHYEKECGIRFYPTMEKILAGIRKLYELVGNMDESIRYARPSLKNMSDYKKLFSSKIKSIRDKINEYEKASSFFKDYETASLQFNRQIQKNIVNPEQDPVKHEFMVAYFELTNHFLSTQVELEFLMQVPIRCCQELKKNKKIGYIMSGYTNWPNLSKFTNIIVKANFVSKHLRKIKLDYFYAFCKLLYEKHKAILENNDNIVQVHMEPEKAAHQIKELAISLLEDMRELEKVEKSSVMMTINIYKEQVLPEDAKNFYEHLSIFQSYMAKYYKLNEEIKALQKLAQTIVARYTGLMVYLILQSDAQ